VVELGVGGGMSRFSLSRMKNEQTKKTHLLEKSALIGLNRKEREVWVRETVLVYTRIKKWERDLSRNTAAWGLLPETFHN